MGTGIMSKPPKNQISGLKAKLASGQGDAGRIQQRIDFLKTQKTDKKEKSTSGGGAKYPYLNKRQAKAINQTNRGDVGLGGAALKQMPGIEDSYATAFDWDGGPQAPVTGDYNQWVDNQMGTYAGAFDKRMDPQFKQQSEDFEQQMANRGIPMGSKLYDQQKELMVQGQNDARTQAFASGQQNAIAGAQALFGVGTQARGNYISEGQAERDQYLNDYNKLMGARSQMPMQNLQYSQQGTLQTQSEKAQMAQQQAQIAAQMKMASMAGAGGGGGSGGPWEAYGMTPQEYDQYKIGLNNQANPKPDKPSHWAGLAGQVGGALLGGWAGNGFKWEE